MLAGAVNDPRATPPARAARVDGTEKTSSAYEQVADKVGLVPNVRKKDNLYQGLVGLARK